MDYYGLKSIISSRKQQAALGKESDSFFAVAERQPAYIEPEFTKLEKFSVEKPAIILISAVGASGKTTTAQALSADTGMPILDLAKHKPVGDNTLSGILIDHYPDNTTDILTGLAQGECGIIIDGIDEGRSKVTEEAFEAFLDDVIKRTKSAPCTSIVILGRSQTLVNTWCYFLDNEASVGLVQIDPFNMDQAKQYIDAHVGECQSAQRATYEEARNEILHKLGAAFKVADDDSDAFITFLGYPPVLDAISTLLREEQNYHRIRQTLNSGAGDNIEINLLIRIGDYLLDREQEEKAQPNFVNDIADEVGGKLGALLKRTLYDREEQCARVLARTLDRSLTRQLISDPGINQNYEKSIETWCPEHPFLQDAKLRNPVFAAISVARCIFSGIDEHRELAILYTQKSEPTYHLLYIMNALSTGENLPIGGFNILMQSCSDFIGANSDISIDIEGDSWGEDISEEESELTLSIEFSNKNQERTFRFNAQVTSEDKVVLGPNIININATLPCDVALSGRTNINIFGECYLSAKTVEFKSPEILMSRLKSSNDDGSNDIGSLVVDTERAFGRIDNVAPKCGQINILCSSHELDYPLVKYVKNTVSLEVGENIKEKYMILRRILILFRSHSKGRLAKYKDKITHERVLKNDVGWSVLHALIAKGILTSDDKMYYVKANIFSELLGINWTDLRNYQSSKKLEQFLMDI